jgi:hypothetical protein
MEKILEAISECEEVESVVSFEEEGFLSKETGWVILLHDGSTYQLIKK